MSMARPEFPVLFMAASKIGAVWMGISPKSSLRELDYLISNSQAVALFSVAHTGERDFASDLDILGSRSPFADALARSNQSGPLNAAAHKLQGASAAQPKTCAFLPNPRNNRLPISSIAAGCAVRWQN